jgi:hypothetical protein
VDSTGTQVVPAPPNSSPISPEANSADHLLLQPSTAVDLHVDLDVEPHPASIIVAPATQPHSP